MEAGDGLLPESLGSGRARSTSAARDSDEQLSGHSPWFPLRDRESPGWTGFRSDGSCLVWGVQSGLVLMTLSNGFEVKRGRPDASPERG